MPFTSTTAIGCLAAIPNGRGLPQVEISSVEVVIRGPRARPRLEGFAPGARLLDCLFGVGISTPAEAGEHGHSGGGCVAGNHDHAHARRVGLDLVPRTQPRVTARYPELADRTAWSLERRQALANGEGDTLQCGARNLRCPVPQREADHRSAKRRVVALTVTEDGEKEKTLRSDLDLCRIRVELSKLAGGCAVPPVGVDEVCNPVDDLASGVDPYLRHIAATRHNVRIVRDV